MRFLGLHLEQFGHFQRARLALPPGRSLVLVHGPNEAGKTTMLEAIRWLLFGGTPSKWAFDVDVAKVAVSAEVSFHSGMKVDLRRSRGKGAGFRGTTQAGDTVDEEWIKGKLQSANKALFENVFGFSLEGLAKGAAALADDDVKNTLYGGGLGSVQPDSILGDLRKESDSLFRERGAARIRTQLETLAELRAKVAASSMQTETFLALERERDARVAAVQAKETELGTLRASEREARKRRDAFAHLQKSAAAQAELDTLTIPDALPADASARHTRAVERRDRLAKDASEAEQRLRAAEAVLRDSLADDDALLLADQVDEVVRGLQRYEKAVADRPGHVAELETLAERTLESLGVLRPSWDLARLRAFRVDAVTRTEVDAALRDHDELVRESARVKNETSKLEADLAAQRSSLEAPALRASDVAALRPWLDGFSGDAARRAELTKLDATIRTSARRRESARKKLAPPLAPDGAPHALVLPRVEQLDALIVESDALRARLSREKDQLDGHARALRQIDADLAKIRAEAEVPSETELRALRHARERAWDAIVEAAHAKTAVEPLLAGYDRVRVAADDAVDRMRAHADLVQGRTLKELDRARTLAERVACESSIAEITRELERVDSAHCALWPGLSPLDPKSMRGFCDDVTRYLEADAAHQEALAARDALASEVDSYLTRGRALLGLADANEGDLRSEAQRRIDREDKRALEAATLERQHENDVRALRQRRDRARELETALTEWQSLWPSRLERLGLEPDLGPAAVSKLLPDLVALRQRLVDGELPLEKLVSRLGDEITGYETRVRALAPGAPSVTVRALEARVKLAREAARKRTDATRELVSAKQKLTDTAQEAQEVETELTALRAAAGVSDDVSFLRVAEQRTRAERLRFEIETSRGAVARIASGPPEPGWVEAVLIESAEALEHALGRASDSVAVADRELRTLEQSVGEAGAKLEAINGRADAADLQGAAELERAALRADAERWAVLTVAESLLRSAIARFEREHQPAVLARASEIFAQMTLGRYPRVRKSGAGLTCDRSDEREVSPEQLSTGTREQLYLAIRLAYIDQYCKSTEPLPVVLDDVLVNFDDARARATLAALAAFGATTQVLLFTCHESTLTLAREAQVDAVPLEIPRTA